MQDEREAAERQSDEKAVHDPAVMHDEIFDASCEQQNRQGSARYDGGEQNHGAGAKTQGRDFRDGVDEAGVDAGRQQHGAAADAGHEIREAHQTTANGATNAKGKVIRRVRAIHRRTLQLLADALM